MTTIVGINWRQKLGSEIEKARKRANLTQQQLSDAVGITRNSIGHYERGERAPDLEILQKIAAILALDEFEIDQEVRVVFQSNSTKLQDVGSAEQLTLNFDQTGGVTLRLQFEPTGVRIKVLSA